ncbi:DUF5694 domain-containing protein (plasmid) [Haladaptatus sp. SPP-AMP-3]|uniref:DUF5694 domain-containing protein n=1 Tax=Haladaptatus sp. SPP-AMP-3 TaxID=3121295 RepID=UPI003C2AC868
MVNTNEKRIPKGWPEPTPEQVQVMVLGTYHMDNPGLDEVNVDADDVLADRRQAELRDLVTRVSEWEPDVVAVERPYDRNESINDRYREYRSGDRTYDREETFPASHSERNELTTECRSEIVQVGFRLADHLDHDGVAAIDEYPDEPDSDPFEDRDIDSGRKTEIELPERDAVQRESDDQLSSSTIPEYLDWINRKEERRFNHDSMFDAGIRAADEPFGSPVALAYWYERNVRMVHHLWRAMDSEDDRILLLVGAGHVRVLRHLLTEAPMFCPVSPLPYLPASG